MKPYLEEGFLVKPVFDPTYKRYAFRIYEILGYLGPDEADVGHVRLKDSVDVKLGDSLENIILKINGKIKELKK